MKLGDDLEPIQLGTGFDATPATNQPCFPKWTTVLDVTRHWDHWQDDYFSMKEAGMREIRFPIHMMDVMPRPGMRPDEWNWGRYDMLLTWLQSLGFELIVDLCHHDARPEWMKGGMADPAFPELLTQFAVELKKRYGWIKKFTLVNEPYPTAWFCTIAGKWYEFKHHDDDAFVRMTINIARAICLAARALKELDPTVKIYQNESCEGHRVGPAPYIAGEEDERMARFCNQRSQLSLDILSGHFRREVHPLGWYVTPERGWTPEVEHWFAKHPAPLDCLMLDYYWEHEHRYYGNGAHRMHAAGVNPLGFADLVMDRYARYLRMFPGLELMMGETNLIGTDPSKISWLGLKLLECKKLQQYGLPIKKVIWMGWMDTALWCSHLTKSWNGTVEGVGFRHINPTTFERSHGLGFEVVQAYNRGLLSLENWPFYEFEPHLAEQLRGFISKAGEEVTWQKPPKAYQQHAYMA